MGFNIPETTQKRIVIVGAGFGGLALAQNLAKKDVQIILIDKNNYHQFQPLFYQVAMAGLEPSSIIFPLRKIFHDYPNVHIRVAAVHAIKHTEKQIETSLGALSYDFLVLAMGADTNFFGMKNIMERAMPMKSIAEAIALRNRTLQNFEDALNVSTDQEREALMSIVVVGGGPTGVEVSGTLAEMKKLILPKDYPELDFNLMHIYLYESSAEVLEVMSDEASLKGKQYLEQLGVNVRNGLRVVDVEGDYVLINNGDKILARNIVWAAGIKANSIDGLPSESIGRGGRIVCNEFNQINDVEGVFVLGDQAIQKHDPHYPNGHPQVAQVAIQQGNQLALNLMSIIKNELTSAFVYKDLGSMATVGRNLAVVDLPFLKFQGWFAWLTWMFVHLMAILGVKNKILIFVNWVWAYVSYDQSLRLIIRQKK